MIQFDEAAHTYTTADGVRLPGITSILRACGLTVDDPHAAQYMERGRRVHLGIQYALEGDYSAADFTDDEAAMIGAAMKAVREIGLKIEEFEAVRGSVELGYATRIDAIGTRAGYRRFVLNWKGPSWMPHYPIQMAAEAQAAGGPALERLGIHLRTDGTFKVHTYKDRADFSLWESALAIYRYVQSHSRVE